MRQFWANPSQVLAELCSDSSSKNARGYSQLIAATHVGRRRDRISASSLRDMGLDPNNRAVGRSGYPGI
jgi:hypothetical protein